MGSEPAPDEQTTPSRETLADRLGTEAITFVDTLGTTIAALLEDTPDLAFDYVVGEVSDHTESRRNPTRLETATSDSNPTPPRQ